MLLSEEPFEGALHLLAFHFDEEVLDLLEVGVEVEGEVVEGVEVGGVDALEEVVDEGRACSLLEVVEDGGVSLSAPLGVGPG